MARTELLALGLASVAEMKVIAVFVVVCGLWATTALHNVQAVTVALLGVVLLIMTKVLAWRDIVREHAAWDVFLWFGGIVRLKRHEVC